MKKTLLLVFSLSFLSVAGTKSDFLRLNKFIYSFEYPNYKQSHRDIFLNGSYDANINETFPSHLEYESVYQYDRNQDFDRNGNGQAGVLLRQIKSSPVDRTDRSLSITANGKLQEKSSINGNNLLGTADTDASGSSDVKGDINYKFSHEKQFGRQGFRNWLFWSINGDIDFYGDDERSKDFHYNNFNETSIDSHLGIYQSIYSELSVSPSLGFGRKRPVQPVYQAFLIEHKLKKSGCLKGNLSDSTLYHLAGLASSVEAYQIKNEKYVKFLMSDVEKIIRKDSAVINSAFDAFALFKLHEVFETELPFFYCGPSVYFSWPIECLGGTRSSYDSQNPDQSFDFQGHFFFDELICSPCLNIEYTFPIITTLFAELKVGLPIIVNPNSTVFYDNNYSGEAALYCMLLDRLIMDCGIKADYDPLWKYKELSLHLKSCIYIEDFISFQCTVQKQFYKNRGHSLNKSADESITLGINYDF